MPNKIAVATVAACLATVPVAKAGPPVCPATAAHYHLSGNAAVSMVLGKSARLDNYGVSDLYLKISDDRTVLWFALDFGSAKGVTALRSSRAPLDRPLPGGQKPDSLLRDVSAHFFDADFRTTGDDLTSRSVAPAYLFISDIDWPRGPRETRERRAFPRQLGSAMFVLDRCTR